MKRLVYVMALLLFVAGTKAQVRDAFDGILPVTDPQMKRSLNGEWQLKVVQGISDDPTVLMADETWGRIPVPGCWEAYGFCKPSYDSAKPMTGYYRTSFSIPKAWDGMNIILRFDGVLYGYDLWVNGKHAGEWRSGYNTALFDITPFLNKKVGQQELAMRVITQFRGSDFDYNDDWAPAGIFRDVTMMAVPKIHLADLTITPKNSGLVVVDAHIANGDSKTVLTHEILDAQGKVIALIICS